MGIGVQDKFFFFGGDTHFFVRFARILNPLPELALKTSLSGGYFHLARNLFYILVSSPTPMKMGV